MADKNPVIGEGKGTTNPVPQSKVDVPIDVPIKIRYRFFPANSTAVLEGEKPQEAKSLSGLPFVIGKVEGTSFTPLADKLLRLSTGTSVAGKLDGGVFRALTAEEVKAWHQALKDAKKKDTPPPQQVYHDTQVVSVKSGTTVGICIGVDAKAKNRKYPLWQVKAGERDIVVEVFETFGKALGLQEKVGSAVKRSEPQSSKDGVPHEVDHYPARLTGDTWLRSTPKLTEADVDALDAGSATTAMKTALKRIYKGDFDAAGANFAIDVPRQQDDKDTATVRLLWIASENANCVNNIASLNLKQDVPSRIHPTAYAAVAKAAHDAEVDEVRFSSSWRPMLGSMPHRLSMGLDLVYLKSGKALEHLNRSGLLASERSRRADNKDALPDEEIKAYDQWQEKVKAAKTADDEAKAADNVLRNATAARNKIRNPAPEMVEKLNKDVADADKAKKAADDAAKTAATESVNAKEAWAAEVEKNEPGSVGRYRRYVMTAKCVSQVLDPWYLVGLGSHKSGELVPNTQEGEGGLAYQHRNHMHLSIKDPELTA